MTKKIKAKPKKRELFLCKNLNSKLPLRNYKDPHHEKTKTFIDQPQEFFNAILYKMNDHAKNSADCSAVWSIVHCLEENMELDFHGLNETLKSLDGASLKNTSKKLKSLITSNTLDEWTWLMDPNDKATKDEDPNINCGVDLRDKDTPNSQIDQQNRNYFDKAVNKIIEEEDKYGMIIKVSLCDKCKSGTSYCAEKLKRHDGIWRCNICEHINNTDVNQYFLYNKIGAFLGSLMDRSEVFNEVTRNSSEVLGIHAKDAVLPAYSTDILERETVDSKRILPINSMFIRNQRTKRILKTHFKSKKKTYMDAHYYDDSTITVGISCAEIEVSKDECYYLFQLYFTSFIDKEIRDLENSHSLMIIPGVPNDKPSNFALDEILAVMYDDINRLSYEGLRLRNSDTGEIVSYRLNLVNFSADPVLLSTIKENINPEITKLTNVHDEKQTLIPHPFYMTYHAERAIVGALLNKFGNSSLKDFIDGLKCNLPQDVPGFEWSNIDDFTLDELKDVESYSVPQLRGITDLVTLALVMHNSAVNAPESLKKIQDLLELLRDIRTTISDMRMQFMDVKELRTFKEKCSAFPKMYQGFLEVTPGYGDPSDTKYISEFSDLYYYYGPIECLVPYFDDLEISVAQTRESYNFKKCLNVLHSMNKVDVVMRNYFSLYAENFILFGCSHPHGRLDDLILASKVKDQRISDSNCLLMFRTDASLVQDEGEYCIKMHVKTLGLSRKAVLNLNGFKPVEDDE